MLCKLATIRQLIRSYVAYHNFAQLEIDDGDELTDKFLYDEVHPKQHEHKQAFAKPRGPAGKRGHKRLIKGPAAIIPGS